MQTDDGFGKKKQSLYLFGFCCCILLTLLAFGVIVYPSFSKEVTLIILYSAALAQFLVQVSCFLRLTTETEQGLNNLWCFIFTAIILMIILACSCWIMWSINERMY